MGQFSHLRVIASPVSRLSGGRICLLDSLLLTLGMSFACEAEVAKDRRSSDGSVGVILFPDKHRAREPQARLREQASPRSLATFLHSVRLGVGVPRS